MSFNFIQFSLSPSRLWQEEWAVAVWCLAASQLTPEHPPELFLATEHTHTHTRTHARTHTKDKSCLNKKSHPNSCHPDISGTRIRPLQLFCSFCQYHWSFFFFLFLVEDYFYIRWPFLCGSNPDIFLPDSLKTYFTKIDLWWAMLFTSLPVSKQHLFLFSLENCLKPCD